MKRITIIAVFLSILLFACSVETKNGTKENMDRDSSDNNILEQIKEEKRKMPSSLNEWKSTLDSSDWYKEIKATDEILF